MELSPEDEALRLSAVAFAKANRRAIAREVADKSVYPGESEPVSVFMAGSPGAGKTEASKELIAEKGNVLRIDPDDLRCRVPSYTGNNSHLFQGAVSILVEKILDVALEQRQSFLLDGTLSDLPKARDNISRCLKRGRTVQILYVYQDPLLAWEFVQARELEEGRSIPVDRFVAQYFAARDVVNQLKVEFESKIKVDLLSKPNDSTQRLYKAGIDRIDNHVPEKYDGEQLHHLLKK
jgi:predicted ABC-type ATPase